MIILLDLNYTLVANNPPRGKTPPKMERRIQEERYRQWLIEMVRPHTVILITARPEAWMVKTLDRIEEETGWRPDDACFAPRGWWNPRLSRSTYSTRRSSRCTAATPAT
jgi:hypothetical protein